MNDIDLGKLRVDRSGNGAAPRRRGFRLRAWHWLAGAAVLVAAWWVMPKPVEVQTTQVVSAWPSQQYQLLNATGYVVAQRKASVSSKGTGRVEWLGVNEGDHVAEGTVVARLESHDVEASYHAAVANTQVAAAAVPSAQNELDDAQRNLDRTTILFDKKLVSLLNLQDAASRLARTKASRASAMASLEAARANEDVARSNLEYTRIRAPFDGVVISRSANVGDIVTPLSSAADAKGAVLVLADMSTLEVDADVAESALSSIKVGQPCEIVLDAFPDKRFRGEISIIVPTVHRASATVTTKVRILDPDPKILPDMSARVAFLSQPADAEQKPVLAVSPSAIVKDGSGDEVYKVGPDAHAHAVKVSSGAQLGGVQAVSGSLQVGDVLVLNPAGKVRDGTAIKPAGTT
ncbi:MAG: efflux RND transporter periplasmic adaptor subunit [Nevskia sp.]|nr:efflux RND transporter periplasmic adaptor subunit [Nevskia sp.]